MEGETHRTPSCHVSVCLCSIQRRGDSRTTPLGYLCSKTAESDALDVLRKIPQQAQKEGL